MEFLWILGWIVWFIFIILFIMVAIFATNKELRFRTFTFLSVIIMVGLIALIATERAANEKPAVKSAPAAVKTTP